MKQKGEANHHVMSLYSKMCFIEQPSSLLNLKTACVTFDQPLWLKAVEIAMTMNLNVTCPFGAFHTIMSLVGSIGTIIKQKLFGCNKHGGNGGECPRPH